MSGATATISAPRGLVMFNPRVRSYSVRRYYDPQTGQFISIDPLVNQTEEPYTYANDDPVDDVDPDGLFCLRGHNSDGTCRGSSVVHDVARGSETALHVGLDLASVPPYAVYYGAYYEGKGINWVGGKLGPVGSFASNQIVLQFYVAPEALGLGGDALLDWIKGHTVNNESICDEGQRGYLNPLHGYLPAFLRGPRVYLPGIHQNGKVDFQW